MNNIFILFDGNKEWARQNKTTLFESQFVNFYNLLKISEWCIKHSVEELGINFNILNVYDERNKENIDLINYTLQECLAQAEHFSYYKIGLKFISNKNIDLPESIIKQLHDLEEYLNREDNILTIRVYINFQDVYNLFEYFAENEIIPDKALFSNYYQPEFLVEDFPYTDFIVTRLYSPDLSKDVVNDLLK